MRGFRSTTIWFFIFIAWNLVSMIISLGVRVLAWCKVFIIDAFLLITWAITPILTESIPVWTPITQTTTSCTSLVINFSIWTHIIIVHALSSAIRSWVITKELWATSVAYSRFLWAFLLLLDRIDILWIFNANIMDVLIAMNFTHIHHYNILSDVSDLIGRRGCSKFWRCQLAGI